MGLGVCFFFCYFFPCVREGVWSPYVITLLKHLVDLQCTYSVKGVYFDRVLWTILFASGRVCEPGEWTF